MKFHFNVSRVCATLVVVLSLFIFSAGAAEKRLFRDLTPEQKRQVFDYAKKSCVFIVQNDGSTKMVQHNHVEECSEPDESGVRTCSIDGGVTKTSPVTEESYTKYVTSGGVVPAVLAVDVVRTCEKCDGKGKSIQNNDSQKARGYHVASTGHIVGGGAHTTRRMDTVSFCSECKGTGKVTAKEDCVFDISLQ